MELFCAALEAAVLDRPVVDKTGLTGSFDFDLKWKPDETQFDGKGGKGPFRGDDNDADIFTAVQDQLGLKLEARKEPVEVLVIDHIEKPDEN
jgi:uncharacterized protein (TIGR03435 family)